MEVKRVNPLSKIYSVNNSNKEKREQKNKNAKKPVFKDVLEKAIKDEEQER